MTFDQLVAEVMGRLNLSSSTALTRVGERVNERYRRVTTDIGLELSRTVDVTSVIDPTVPNSTLPDLTIYNMEKIQRIQLVLSAKRWRTLGELTYDSLTNGMQSTNRLPENWAPKSFGARSVIITLDSFTTTTPFTLKVEGYAVTSNLSGSQEPAFPEDFHDILVHGVMADELQKMEKPDLSQLAESKYELRLSGLRMFIAKSAYRDQYQGKDQNDSWYTPWYVKPLISY